MVLVPWPEPRAFALRSAPWPVNTRNPSSPEGHRQGGLLQTDDVIRGDRTDLFVMGEVYCRDIPASDDPAACRCHSACHADAVRTIVISWLIEKGFAGRAALEKPRDSFGRRRSSD